MSKPLFKGGGQPLYLGDPGSTQNASADTVRGVVNTYGNVIFSRCNVLPPIAIVGHPTTYGWEEGCIAINEGVYRVEEGSFQGGLSANLYWKVVSTEGQKEIYENIPENNMYQYRKMEFIDTVASSDIYVSASSVKDMNDYLMIHGEREIRIKVSGGIPEDGLSASFRVLKSNQGFDIAKINFRILKAFSGAPSPWVYYDYYEADHKPRIVVRNDNFVAIHAFQLVNGAIYMYNIPKQEVIRDFPEGFSYQVQFSVKK